ncbi:hypothetical protein ACFL27_09290, partial [candidate division CSSED10-310 bacterium]
SFYNGKVYFMFNTGKEVGATAFLIENLDRTLPPGKLQQKIQKQINDGWVPFDLTYSPKHLIMLYLKCAIPIMAWKIVTCERSWTAIETTIKNNKGFFPLGFTFTNKEAYILIIKSPKAGVSNWLLKNCGAKEKVFNAKVNGVVGQGYTPYGFEYKGDQVGVCFLK